MKGLDLKMHPIKGMPNGMLALGVPFRSDQIQIFWWDDFNLPEEVSWCIRCGLMNNYEGICPRCVKRLQREGGVR